MTSYCQIYQQNPNFPQSRHKAKNTSTWIYENRVSKHMHFVISLNFPRLSLFTVLFAYVFFWLFCG